MSATGDGYVQVQADSTGKKVDTSELTRDDATIVERQRSVIADGANVESGGLAEIRDRKLQVGDRNAELLERVTQQLDEILFILKANLG